MSDWLHNLSVGWMTVVFFGCAYLSAAVIYAIVVEFPTSLWIRARAFSASMLSPMGTLGLFVVFTAAQVWTDNDQATAAVDREASALRNILSLATAFPGKSRDQLETLVHNHIVEAATKEWPQMAHRSLTLGNPPHNLVEALELRLSLTPSNPSQGIAQRELATALESALDARRQRVLISPSAVGLVKWACLVIQALCVLIAIALSHGDRRAAAAVAMELFATGAAACFLLIGLYDRPFTGQFSIKPDPLVQIRPEAAAPAALKQ